MLQCHLPDIHKTITKSTNQQKCWRYSSFPPAPSSKVRVQSATWLPWCCQASPLCGTTGCTCIYKCIYIYHLYILWNTHIFAAPLGALSNIIDMMVGKNIFGASWFHWCTLKRNFQIKSEGGLFRKDNINRPVLPIVTELRYRLTFILLRGGNEWIPYLPDVAFWGSMARLLPQLHQE